MEDDYNQDEIQFGGTTFAQKSQYGIGDPSSTVSGQGKIHKLIQKLTTSKADLYYNRLIEELEIYNLSYEVAKGYADEARKIPKYWYKNITTLAQVLIIYRKLNKNPNITDKQLLYYRDEYQTDRVDLLRYYRLVSKYIK